MTFQSSLHRLKSRIFLAHGRRPFARGYLSYRHLQLQQYLSEDMPDGRLPKGWGLWLDERVVEYPWFLSRLPPTPGKLLDAGSALNHDYLLSHDKLRNKTTSIFTLAPEPECYWKWGISYVYGDLRDCCFRDEYFDYIASVSTLEHVGMDNTRFYTSDSSKNEYRPESYMRALSELRRVLKLGGVLYLTLPYGSAKNYGWLQIFDSTKIEKVLNVFCPAASQAFYFRYTSLGWQVASKDDCQNARYYDPVHNGATAPDFAAAEAVVCLELVK